MVMFCLEEFELVCCVCGFEILLYDLVGVVLKVDR